MKRKMSGEIKVVGYYSVAGGECIYVLPFEDSEYWEYKKRYVAIALCWQGKKHFRRLYFRRGQYCFKFFNRAIYLSEIEFIEGTHEWLVL